MSTINIPTVAELMLKSKEEIISYYEEKLRVIIEGKDEIVKSFYQVVDLAKTASQDGANDALEKIKEKLPGFISLNQLITDKDKRVIKFMSSEQTQRKNLESDGLSRKTIDNITYKLKELTGFDSAKRLNKKDWIYIREWVEKNLYLEL